MSSTQTTGGTEDLARVATLNDPVRRRLYDYICERDGAVGRDEAAQATSISRSLAAYHLDKLAERNLLTVTYRRAEGRGGPGAGRPAKLYARPEREIAVSLPHRDYKLAAELLAQAADGGEQDARAAARRHGVELANVRRDRRRSRPRALHELLRERGYEPIEAPDGGLRLRNCPFHAVARSHPDLVCGLNLALVEGILEGLDAPDRRARLDPQPGHCCVEIRPPE